VLGFFARQILQSLFVGGDFVGVDELAEVDDFVDDAGVDWVDGVGVGAVDDGDTQVGDYNAVKGFWVAGTDEEFTAVFRECVGETKNEGAFADAASAFKDI